MIVRFIRWFFRFEGSKDCEFCNAKHYNECASAREVMGIATGATWECVDGRHR